MINAGTYNQAVVVNNTLLLHFQQGPITFGSFRDTVSDASYVLDGITLTIGGNNSSTQIDSHFTGTGGITKVGTGTTILASANINTGTTTVSGGVLQAGIASAINPVTDVIVNSPGTLRLNGFDTSFTSLAGSGTVENANATAVILTVGSGNTNTTFSGNLVNGGSGSLSLAKVGTGNMTLSGVNTYTGTTTITGNGILTAGSTTAFSPNSAFTLAAGNRLRLNGFNNTLGSLAGSGGLMENNAATSAILTVGADDSTTLFGGTIQNGAAGALTLLKTGTGTFTLNVANTYTGNTIISQGTIRSATLTSTQGTITLGDVNTGANNIAWLFAGSLDPTNNIVVANQGTGTVSIGTYSGGTSTIPSGSLTLNRPVTLVDATGDRTTFTGQITGNVGTITTAGNFRITFGNATNNFVGDLVVGVGTYYQNDVNGALPSGLSVTDNGRFRLNNSNQTINSLNGNGIVDNVTGANTLIVGTLNGSGVFSGSLQNGSGALSLTKTGTGTLTLSGASTNTGTTTVSNGTLLFNGTSTGSPFNVTTSGTLGGTGVISAAVTANGILAPGTLTTAGALGTGNLTLSASTILDMDINGTTPGVNHDRLNVIGTVALGGATLSLTVGFTASAGNTFVLINNNGTDAISGIFAGLAEGASVGVGGQDFTLTYLYDGGSDGNLNDVALIRTASSIVYVDDAWLSLNLNDPIADADPVAGGRSLPLTV